VHVASGTVELADDEVVELEMVTAGARSRTCESPASARVVVGGSEVADLSGAPS
jgi:transcription termination factor Rho